jgi:hypothetical protein
MRLKSYQHQSLLDVQVPRIFCSLGDCSCHLRVDAGNTRSWCSLQDQPMRQDSIKEHEFHTHCPKEIHMCADNNFPGGEENKRQRTEQRGGMETSDSSDCNDLMRGCEECSPASALVSAKPTLFKGSMFVGVQLYAEVLGEFLNVLRREALGRERPEPSINVSSRGRQRSRCDQEEADSPRTC